MASRKQGTGGLESEPFARITFCLQREHGTQTIHEADCPLTTQIGGLKLDMSHMFGCPVEKQRWFYNSTLLTDDTTLLKCGIDGGSRKNSQIVVKVET